MRWPDRRPAVAAPPRWHFPDPDRLWLDNGLQVILCHRRGQHVAAACLSLDIPLSLEPDEYEGVATLTERTLSEGTEQHPGSAFAEALEDIGAALDTSAGFSATQLFLDVPAGRLAEALLLLAEAVRTPQLTTADIERHQQLRLAEIEQTAANSAALAGLSFRAACIRPRFRAARPAGGTTASVAAITPGAVRDFHARYHRPEGATLIITADLDESVMTAVREAFDDWTLPGTVEVSHQVPGRRRLHRWIVDRPGAVQADVRLGVLGIDRADPRWPEVQAATHAVGGAFLSRLNKVLREERGFSYGVHLVNQPLRSGGLLAVQGSFRTEVVAEAISTAAGLLDVTSRPLTEVEIGEAISYSLGSAPLRYSTAVQVTEALAGLTAAGLTADFINTNAQALAQVSAESATHTLAELLPPDRLSLVVVGDQEALAAPLAEAGWPCTPHRPPV